MESVQLLSSPELSTNLLPHMKDTSLGSTSSSSPYPTTDRKGKQKSTVHERSYAFIHITSVQANMYTHDSCIQPVELTFAKLIPISKDTTDSSTTINDTTSNSTVTSQSISSNTSDTGSSRSSEDSKSILVPPVVTTNSSSPVSQSSLTNNAPSPRFRATSKSSIPLLLIQYTTNDNLTTVNNIPLLGLPLMIVKPDNIESIYFENGVMRIVRMKTAAPVMMMNSTIANDLSSPSYVPVREEIFFSTTEVNITATENWNKQVQMHVLAFQSYWASLQAKLERKEGKARKLEKKGQGKELFLKEVIVPDSPNTGMTTSHMNKGETCTNLDSTDHHEKSSDDEENDDEDKNNDNDSIFTPSTTTTGNRHGVLRSSSKTDRAGLSRREFRRLLIEGRLKEFQETENDPEKRQQMITEIQALVADPSTEPVKKNNNTKSPTATAEGSFASTSLSNKVENTTKLNDKGTGEVVLNTETTEKSNSTISGTIQDSSATSVPTVVTTLPVSASNPSKEWSSMVTDDKDDNGTEYEPNSTHSSTVYQTSPYDNHYNHNNFPSWSPSSRNNYDYNNSNRGRPRYRGSMHHYSNNGGNSSFASQSYSSPQPNLSPSNNNRHHWNYGNDYRNNNNNNPYYNNNSPWNNNNNNNNDKVHRERTNSFSSTTNTHRHPYSTNKGSNYSVPNNNNYNNDTNLNTAVSSIVTVNDGKDNNNGIIRHNSAPVSYYPTQDTNTYPTNTGTMPSPVISPSPTSPPTGYQMYTVTIPVPVNPSTGIATSSTMSTAAPMYPSYPSPLPTSMNTATVSSTNSTLVPVHVPMSVPMLVTSNSPYASYGQGQAYMDPSTIVPFTNSSPMLSMQLLAMAQQQYQMMVQQKQYNIQAPTIPYQYVLGPPAPENNEGSSSSSVPTTDNSMVDHSNHGQV